MLDRADVVVIDSGGFGASTAFHLVERAAGDVVVVDRHDLASQTSPRAAGLVSHARTTERLCELVQRAAAKRATSSAVGGSGSTWGSSPATRRMR